MACQTLKSEACKCLKSREARAAFARAELAICVKITKDDNFYTGTNYSSDINIILQRLDS